MTPRATVIRSILALVALVGALFAIFAVRTTERTGKHEWSRNEASRRFQQDYVLGRTRR
jgi:hypothetical protein